MPLVCCVTLENDFAPGILFTIKANGLVKYGLFFKAELDEIGYLYFIDFYIKTEKINVRLLDTCSHACVEDML